MKKGKELLTNYLLVKLIFQEKEILVRGKIIVRRIDIKNNNNLRVKIEFKIDNNFRNHLTLWL